MRILSLRRLVLGALLTCTLPAWAQASAPRNDAPAFDVRGTTLDGKPFSLGSLRGKVVMVFFWSTDCAVCRSKMPELRANAEGWRGKPFELVFVSVDRRRADLVDYDKAWSATQSVALRFPSLWAGEAGYADTLRMRPQHLPLSFVLDAQGSVRARFEGRIPAEAWDAVAELLP